jgi:hypothetical protein
MGTDEEGTLTALKAIRHELIDPKIAEHRGRVVKPPNGPAISLRIEGKVLKFHTN